MVRGMAAWIVVGVVMGMCVGAGGMWVVAARARRLEAFWQETAKNLIPASPPPAQHPDDHAILARVLDRLLDATVPAPRDGQADAGEEPPGHQAEYEPPPPDVMDWTDPFIGLERPTVARLAPGQGIPGMGGTGGEQGVDPVEMWRQQGEGAFDEWARDTMQPEGVEATDYVGGESWVEPVEGV